MKKAALVVHEFYKNNRIFDISDTVVNRDNCVYHMYLLKEQLATKGVELVTDDIYDYSEYDCFFMNDVPPMDDPKTRAILESGKDLYLIIGESEVIIRRNWVLENHKHFKKIFTWSADLIDNQKYFQYYWPNKIVIPEGIVDFGKKKLATMISGNKVNSDKRELYTERLNAVKWFEKHHPEDFDFYGMGWDQGFFKGFLGKIFNRYGFVRRALRKKYKCFGGKVDSKQAVLKNYKFSICYENARDIDDYITEKIFDCFFAGCVPIYLGAPNITNYVPKDCFISRDDFSSYDELYKYISTMKEDEYNRYLERGTTFLKSEKMNLFSAEYFADTVVKGVIGD